LGFPAGQLTDYSDFVGLGSGDGEPLRFTNGGPGATGALNATIVSQSGTTEFAVQPTSSSPCQGNPLAVGAECRVQIAFDSAGTVGGFTATLRLADTGGNSIDVQLTGTIHEDFSVTGDPTQWVVSATPGDEFDAFLTITNDADLASGTLAASLVSPTGVGTWSVVGTANNCVGQTLASGASCNVELRLTSGGGSGPAGVTLRVEDPAGNAVEVVVSGTVGP
jgi:hypothetical protein